MVEEHPLVEGSWSGKIAVNPVDTGDMWECPDFFPVGNKHVLLISTMGKVRWKMGTYANQRFTPEKEGVVDWGSYYAAKTMLDRNGRRILWGWITESRPDAELIKAGWAGAMSLPRVLSLSPDNQLETAVAPEASLLRGESLVMNHKAQSFGNIQIRDLAAELDVHLQPAADFVLHLYSDSGEFATISRSGNSGDRTLHINNYTCPLPEEHGSVDRLHIFLDGSVVEVFANHLTSLTARVYQIPSGPLRLKLEGAAKIESLAAWQMKPISNNRPTSP